MKVWSINRKENAQKLSREKNTDYIKGSINEIVNFLQRITNSEGSGLIPAKS